MSFASRLPYPVLLGDIGGTNARFAVLAGPDAAMAPLPRGLTRDFAGPVDAIRALSLGQAGPEPRSALLAVATRVEGPVARLTNASWVVDAGEIGAELGLEAVWLLNDFVPVAASLPLYDRHSAGLVRIGPEVAVAPGPRLVVGPGTGLGAAALRPVDGQLLVESTEAGHTDLGPAEEDEMAIWPLIERVGGRVTAEAMLSGPGLLRIYGALGRLRDRAGGCRIPNDVIVTGTNGSDPLAAEALQLFARLLGRFAGDLALTFEASAAYVAGGIAPKILEALGSGAFRAAFEPKAPYADRMRSVPTFVITDPDPALKGLCAIAADPGRYAFAVSGWTGARG
jgi:glucokinase